MPALPRTRYAHSPVHDTPRVSAPPTIWGQGIQFVKEDDAGSSCPGSGKHWEETESTRDEEAGGATDGPRVESPAEKS